MLRRYYGLPRLNQARIEEEKVPTGIGSGVIVSPQGHVVTNAHVITDPRTGELMEEVLVQMGEQKEYPADVIGYDHTTDIAVLKIDAEDELPFATLANSDQLQVGDIVFAVGNPLGIGMTVTMGIISATESRSLVFFEKKELMRILSKQMLRLIGEIQGVPFWMPKGD